MSDLKDKWKQKVEDIDKEKEQEFAELESIRKKLEQSFAEDAYFVDFSGQQIEILLPTPRQLRELRKLTGDETEMLEKLPKLLAEFAADDELNEEFWENVPWDRTLEFLNLLMGKVQEVSEKNQVQIERFR